MEQRTEQVVNLARTLFAARVKVWSDKLTKLTENAAIEKWYATVLQNLWAELNMAYGLLEHSYEHRDGPLALSRPALLAWRSRNLLELWVWSAYCLKDKRLARRFYEDKSRDFIDWVSAGQELLTFAPQFEDAMQSAEESKNRIRDLASAEGIGEVDESYTRVNSAARDVDVGLIFGSMNKLLSKFAHPTAFTVLTDPDEVSRDQICDILVLFGAVSFIGAFQEFQQFFGKDNHLPQLAHSQ